MDGKRFPIYSPRFVGVRFESHRLPLDVVGDLALLETMTIAMAKHLFLSQNPSRQRVPKNFTNGISFELENINSGSTIPEIVLVSSATEGEEHASTHFFEEARNKILDAVQAADDGANALEHAPASVLRYFSKFGTNLRDDEYIEFNPDGEFKAKLNKNSRRRLVQASSRSHEYTEKVSVRGYISAMDQLKTSFHLEFANGQRIEGIYTETEEEIIRKAFNGYPQQQKVLIEGIGRFNEFGKMMHLEEINEVVPLEDMDIAFRLDQLAALKNGWFDGQGRALDRGGILWLAGAFDQHYDSDLPLPAIFPTPEGGIQAEWSSPSWEISLSVSLESRLALLCQLDLGSDQEIEDELDLSKGEDWSTICQAIKTRFSSPK